MTYQTDSSSRGREARVQGRPGPLAVRQGAQERAARPLPGCRSCPRARKNSKNVQKRDSVISFCDLRLFLH
jgi:hypothetical protein